MCVVPGPGRAKKDKSEERPEAEAGEQKPKAAKKIPKIKGLRLREAAAAANKTSSSGGGEGGGGGGGGAAEKSVEEWNAERAKLGLKPLK